MDKKEKYRWLLDSEWCRVFSGYGTRIWPRLDEFKRFSEGQQIQTLNELKNHQEKKKYFGLRSKLTEGGVKFCIEGE